MNKGAKKELLIDTFDVLKDMWPVKKEAIYKVLKSTKSLDLDMMMGMWEYLLKKNDILAHQNDYESYSLLDGLVSTMFTEGCLGYYPDATFSMAAYKNEIIRRYLFSINPRLEKYTAIIIARLIPNIPLDEVRKILDQIGGRKIKESDMGEIISLIIEHTDKEDVNKDIKDFLFNYITSMSDRTERAVAYAAYLEID